jgi:LmbE family N-acetylglucosaminyl deacetylase
MLRRFWRSIVRFHKLIFVILLLWAVVFSGVGTFLGWYFTKASLNKFPALSPKDKILIISPHIDDETISSAGLIQRALKTHTPIKTVYLTNGDNSWLSAVKIEKDLKFTPADLILLGEQRMTEARRATAVLGLKSDDLIFLGFPDQGLSQLFYNPLAVVSARGSKLTYNPYNHTYQPQQAYTGQNLLDDLTQIINSFQPTIIIAPHPLDHHPDHRAAYEFIQKLNHRARLYTYLIHYRFYPDIKGLKINEFLYPPKKLFTKENWFSLDLDSAEETKKLQAIRQYSSQMTPANLLNLPLSFVRRNEIFEFVD